jgi:imidazolonepropionase-like amidohydrolase
MDSGKKREAAHAILYSQSDHPILNSQHLLFEAQQAYFYGLPAEKAIASVTSTPAKVAGMDHRIGFLKKGRFTPNIAISSLTDYLIFQVTTPVNDVLVFKRSES